MVKNNYFFFFHEGRGGWRKCKKHEQQKKVFLGMSCSSEENVLKQSKAIMCVFMKECETLRGKKRQKDRR